MRYCVFLLLAAAAMAQDTKTYVYDVNGNPAVFTETRQTKTRNGKTVVESLPSLNGGSDLDERVEERVIESTPASRIIERTITYGSGEQAKVRTEEKTLADGSTTVTTTEYKDDGNGSLAIAQKSVEHSHGGVSETVIERPTIDGSLAVVEKKAGTSRQVGATKQTTVITYRQDANGNFDEAVREVSVESKTKQGTSLTTDQYLAGQLNARTVTKTTAKAGGGAEIRETSIYGMTAPGKTESTQLQLREQQLVERRSIAGGTEETFSIRRPSVDDTRDLGQFQLVSKKICTGCK